MVDDQGGNRGSELSTETDATQGIKSMVVGNIMNPLRKVSPSG